jgi:hypothetical protein
MRYALRNKHKIKAHFEPKGQEILSRILLSLDEHFKRYEDPINGHADELEPGEKYRTLIINDAGHTCACISFYILGITYDVCRIAFVEFIG